MTADRAAAAALHPVAWSGRARMKSRAGRLARLLLLLLQSSLRMRSRMPCNPKFPSPKHRPKAASALPLHSKPLLCMLSPSSSWLLRTRSLHYGLCNHNDCPLRTPFPCTAAPRLPRRHGYAATEGMPNCTAITSPVPHAHAPKALGRHSLASFPHVQAPRACTQRARSSVRATFAGPAVPIWAQPAVHAGMPACARRLRERARHEHSRAVWP
jgi:hypothetical protein